MVAGNLGNVEERTPRRTTAVVEHRDYNETKASLKTTELWMCLAVVAGVLIATQRLDNLDAWDGWRLVTALAVGYMLSRGLAKSGSRYSNNEN